MSVTNNRDAVDRCGRVIPKPPVSASFYVWANWLEAAIYIRKGVP